MGKYSCRECQADGGFHYDEDGKPSRCPNYLSTVQHEQALELTRVQRDQAFKAACQIIKDHAEIHQEFSANRTRAAMAAAQIPGPTVGRAFDAMRDEGVIEDTGRTEPSTDPGTKRHKITVWLSKKHPAYVANHSSPFVAAGVSRSTGRQSA